VNVAPRLEVSGPVRAALKGHDPTPEQWAAITHEGGRAYLIAGAGSGKTAVMAARIVWLIEAKGYAPSQILGLTFTNKAAEELAERVRLALDAGSEHRLDDITVQTYNAFAAGIVREHGLLVDVEADAGLLTDAQQWQLVLNCIDELPPFDAIEFRTPGSIVRATLGLAGSLADHIVSTGDVRAVDQRTASSRDASNDMRSTSERRIELCNAVDAYLGAKRRHGRIDFGDQVGKAVEVLEDFPQIQRSYVERFPVVLLDEYQDTNVAQRRMLQAMTDGGDFVTAVGDARQAIFAWRGATMYNLIEFPGHFPRADRKPYSWISLSENFRSGSRILKVANAVAGRIDEKRRPGLPLRAHNANGEGYVGIALFEDERSEASFIADECERRHGEPTGVSGVPTEWRDMAILVRRRASMDVIREVLKERDIPVEVVGLSGLLNTPEVLEIVAWLRAIDPKPAANRWLARLLMGPRWRVHYRDLALCARWAAQQNQDLRLRLAGGDAERARDLAPGDVGFSLSEALDHIDAIDALGGVARSRLTAFGDRLARLRRLAHLPLIELLQEVILTSGVKDALQSSPARSAPAGLQNIANFVDHVAGFSPIEGEATLRSFLTYLDAAEAAEETLESAQPAEQNSVKLMTVHSAKGLEFEIVFVPSVAASKNKNDDYIYSVFPNTRSSNPLRSYDALPYEVREDRTHLPEWTGKARDFEAAVKDRTLEDERRLFYVALTRAKQRLYVSSAWWYGRGDREKGPSVFLDELGGMCREHGIHVISKVECPAKNPVLEVLESQRAWPPPAHPGADDPLFVRGWGAAADEALAERNSIERLATTLDEEGRARLEELEAHYDNEFALIERGAAEPDSGAPRPPEVLSATTYVRLLKGDLGIRELSRPVPERPTTARRLGTEIHRIIEERARAVSAYPEETELDDPAAVAGLGAMETLISNWQASGYAERELAVLPSGEPMIELPFTLRLDDEPAGRDTTGDRAVDNDGAHRPRILRGRMDAVYVTEDGGYEIVDFKTGKRFEPGEQDQLAIYARALKTLGFVADGAWVTLTYLFLDGDEPVTRHYEP
jgi:DNA helicase-2/ATP-dependent DNA helicase PcrA